MGMNIARTTLMVLALLATPFATNALRIAAPR